MTATVLPRWLDGRVELDLGLGDRQVGDANPDALDVHHGYAVGASLQHAGHHEGVGQIAVAVSLNVLAVARHIEDHLRSS